MNDKRDYDKEYQETKSMFLFLAMIFGALYVWKHERELMLYYETHFEMIWMTAIGGIAVAFWVAKKIGGNKNGRR